MLARCQPKKIDRTDNFRTGQKKVKKRKRRLCEFDAVQTYRLTDKAGVVFYGFLKDMFYIVKHCIFELCLIPKETKPLILTSGSPKE
jgi:hypothetical protein